MTEITKDRAELFNRLFTIENNWRDVLYVHTPFCVRKCYYCVYSSKEPSGPGEMDDFYNNVLPRQIEGYRSILETAAFHQVYFGGGTPTIADAHRLEQVYKKIPRFMDIPVKITEASPYTVTDDHIDLFREYRFSYVSLGVQTLSTRILEAQNRKVVGKEKLIHICRRLDEYGIINNIDLICYLDTGGPADLEQTREDLTAVMSEIKPVSITIHSNYTVEKTMEKQSALVRLIREMIDAYPGYRCVNALLEDSEIETDMKNAAEYRLMRKRDDFYFYMTPKIPDSHRYGHNMIALGAYEKFKPRYNYYYIFDYADKYSFKTLMKKYKALNGGFEQTRDKLGLPDDKHITRKNFFKNEEDEEQFKKIIINARLPYYRF